MDSGGKRKEGWTDGLAQGKRERGKGVENALGLARLALCPLISLAVCSFPSLSSFMSLDRTDLAPSEDMVPVVSAIFSFFFR